MNIIFDLDGTLAMVDHRRHLVDGSEGKKDFDAFIVLVWMTRRTCKLFNCTMTNLVMCIWTDVVKKEIGCGNIVSTELRMRKHFSSDVFLKEKSR